jgi:alkanesulfonate monooxygenase SsuD/methylene tetrahydromethanopterin reductase-like flavin-dependent oxidoreductase (luciferase family)
MTSRAEMKVGFVSPGASPDLLVRRAIAAEEAGWDAFLLAEGAYHVDPWCVLSAVAPATTRIRLGTLLTPLPWRRPWTVAAQAATLDRLSGGRVILSVGLGSPETGRGATSEPTDRRTKAHLLDEGLSIIDRLWRGELEYAGEHLELAMAPNPPRDLRPVQQPRIPIWVVGGWRSERSMSRAARYDGVIPQMLDRASNFGRELQELAGWVAAHHREDGTTADVIWEGETSTTDAEEARARVTRWRDRGATWWLESRWGSGEAEIMERIEAGPARPYVD